MCAIRAGAPSGLAAPILVMIRIPRCAQAAALRASAPPQRVIAGVGVAQPLLLGERDSALGKALEPKVLNVPMLGEFHRRLYAVARVARA
jgi:hypothetical protein